jgi:hypothetical protein
LYPCTVGHTVGLHAGVHSDGHLICDGKVRTTPLSQPIKESESCQERVNLILNKYGARDGWMYKIKMTTVTIDVRSGSVDESDLKFGC